MSPPSSANRVSEGPQLRDHKHHHLVSGSAWLITTVGVNAIGGLAFWLIAYRIDSADDVGVALGMFAAVMFTTFATSMGLPVAVGRFGHGDSPSAAALFRWALAYTAATSLLGTLVFRSVASEDVAGPLDRAGPLAGTALFFFLVAGMSFAALVDVRLMTLRRWGWLPARVLIVSIARLPLLFVRPIDDDALWLLLLSAGVPALSGFVGAALLCSWRPPWSSLRAIPDFSAIFRYSMVNYIGVLTLQAPQFVVPLIVLANVEPPEFAAFYVVWSATTIVILLPHVIGQALLAEGGRDPSHLEGKFRLALAVAVGLMMAIAIVGAGFPEVLTFAYGPKASGAVPLLDKFLLACVFWAVTSTCLNRARVRTDSVGTIVITVTMAMATLSLAVILTAQRGIEGTADAWLLGNALAACIAATTLLRGRTPPVGSIAVANGAPREPVISRSQAMSEQTNPT